MSTVNEKEPIPHFVRQVFDENFRAVSFHPEGEKLTRIEIEVRHDDDEYMLVVEAVPTWMVHTDEEIQEASASTAEEADKQDQIYTVLYDEILPSHLVDIKNNLAKSFEVFKPYLVLQDREAS